MKPIVITPKTCAATYAALMLLLAITCGASRLHLGPLAIVVALSVATAKMLLIMVYFMHLRVTHRTAWLAAGAGFFWLGILFTLALSDYLTRGWQ